MILEGFFALCMQDADISALIGSRLYPELLPENPTLPAATYYVAGGNAEPTFDTSGLQQIRIHVDAHALTYKDAVAVRQAFKKLLNGYRGVLPDADQTFLELGLYIGPTDSPFGRTARQFRLGGEFYLKFNE